MLYQWRTSSEARLIPTIALLIVVVTYAYGRTIITLFDTWYRSDTYTHGFLILPISLWLIWQSKNEFIHLTPRFFFLPVVLTFLLSILWGVAYISGIQVVHQFLFISILITSLWALLGTALISKIKFPLFFLYFSVPFGSDLIPPLMIFTADFTVMLIEAFGIPIYREGLYFELPTGRWSVVEACSGINYLLASVTLGTFFAFITYSSNRKRAIFIVAAILVPIIANGLRAFMIVMIGHLSSMKLAVGVDHLLYGWVFFGIIMMILFSLGSKWKDEIPITPPTIESANSTPIKYSFFSIAPILLAVSVGPIFANYGQSVNKNSFAGNISLPQTVGDWKTKYNLHPLFGIKYFGYSDKLSRIYTDSKGNLVDLQVFVYQKNQQGKELVNSENSLIDNQSRRERVIGRKSLSFLAKQERVDYIETDIISGTERYVVRHWYLIGDISTTNSYMAKFLEIAGSLYGSTKPSLAIFVITKASTEKKVLIEESFFSELHKSLLKMMTKT